MGETAAARTGVCPVCKTASTYFPDEGRWYHADMSPNDDCWAVSNTSPHTVRNPEAALTRETNTSNGSNTDRENVDLLAGVRSGAWLDAQEFPPLRYAVDGVIPEGFTLLAGPPKAGKSYLALGLLLAKAAGGMALGKIPAGEPGRVLYIALEDGDRRMQTRCRDLLGWRYAPTDPIPERFHYLTRVMPGLVVPTIEAFIDQYEDTALVVIDTLGKVMPPPMPNETTYGRDYRIGGRLKQISDDRPGLAVVALHHDRKAVSDDFVERVSGTNGLAGAADTVIVLARKRQSPDGLLQVTGRDVPEGEYALSMGDSGAWTLDGADLADAANTARQRAETTAGLSDLSLQVLDFVRDGSAEGVARKDIVAKFGRGVDMYIKRLIDSGRIERHARGRYRDPETHTPPLEVLEALETQVSGSPETNTAQMEVLETDADDQSATPLPGRQRWKIDGFRVSVLVYKSHRGQRCHVCGQTGAIHYVSADRDDGMSGMADFCDEHRPAKGTLPDLDIENVSHDTTGDNWIARFERLTANPAWECTTCGQPAVVRVEDRCVEDTCDEPAHWRQDVSQVIAHDGSERTETRRVHELTVIAETFHCEEHTP